MYKPVDFIMQLSSGEHIKSGTTILICGATGTGKSFLACALGNKACRLGYKVVYYTMQKLMDVIIIDDFEQILDDRYKRKALIISSQLPVSDWHALFRNELIADAFRNGVRIDLTAKGTKIILI